MPKQIDPAIDPIEPREGSKRYFYHILQEPHSPSIAPPNAIEIKQFERPKFLFPDDPKNFMVTYGFGQYERELTDDELRLYNMLPMDYDAGLLFRLRQEFNEDAKKLLEYCSVFFKMIEDDPLLLRFDLIKKLRDREWDLKKIQAEIKKFTKIKRVVK